MLNIKLRPVSALILASSFLLSATSHAQLPASYTLDDKKLLWAEAVSYYNGMKYHYDLLRFDTREAALACSDKSFSCLIDKKQNKQSFTLPLPTVPLYLKETVSSLAESNISKPLQDPANNTWVMVSMTTLKVSNFLKEVNANTWLNEYALTALPTLGDLKTDPKLTVRREMGGIYTQASLLAAIQSGKIQPQDINTRLANGTTLLRRSIFLQDAEMMDILLKNGARADICTPKCPLNDAIYVQNQVLVNKLLDAGAKPDGEASDSRPLTMAARKADKEIVELLLARGANPLLPQADASFGVETNRSLLQYSPSDNPAFVEWLQEKINARLEKSGKYTWSAWIEQGKQKTRLTDNAVIKLKKAPFRITMQINPVQSFRLICSDDVSLLQHVKKLSFRREMLSPFNIGASADDSKYLSCGKLAMEDGRWKFEGSSKELSYAEKEDEKTGTQRTKGHNGTEYSYSVTELIIGGEIVSLAQYKGKDLAVIIGTVPNSGMGADYFRPASFTLKFQ